MLAGREISEAESAAAGALLSIAAAQERFRSGDLDGDGAADYATHLYELAAAGRAGRELPAGLAAALGSPRPVQWRGYLFSRMRGSWEGRFDPAERFGAQAVPAEYGRTGVRSFYITDAGTVYSRDTGGVPVMIEPRDPGAEGWSHPTSDGR